MSERYLATDDALFLYTDGFVEAHRADGEQFEDERLMKALSARRNGTPEDLIEGVFRDVETFCEGTFDDDVTMLAVRRNTQRPSTQADQQVPEPVPMPN